MTEDELEEINWKAVKVLTYLQVLKDFAEMKQHAKYMGHVSIIVDDIIDLTKDITRKF